MGWDGMGWDALRGLVVVGDSKQLNFVCAVADSHRSLFGWLQDSCKIFCRIDVRFFCRIDVR